MALKKFILDDGLELTVYKRRGSRSIRLSVTADGQVRATMPSWLPYKAATEFARTRLNWIQDQRQLPGLLLEGQKIGKAHTVHYRVSARAVKPTSRIKDNLIIVTHPLATPTSATAIQKMAEQAAIRALRQEATLALPGRLHQLAQQHGFVYKDVTIKLLTSRWGSCDQQQRIALNLYLMQLPWPLIDYVLLHELVHTRHMHHSEDFWTALENVSPGAKNSRAAIRKHKPVVLR